jgi:cystathionine beta-lyase/cystathionine gamma-synthase
MSKLKQETLVARYAVNCDPAHNAVIPPLHLSSTFAFRKFGEKGRYDYTRSGNPTRDHLGGALAAVEGGAGAVITASGMAAAPVTQLLQPGDVLVARMTAMADATACFQPRRASSNLCCSGCPSGKRGNPSIVSTP